MDVSKCIEKELLKEYIPQYKQNRLKAIKYYLKGYTPVKISNEIGISLRSIQRYIKDYKETGIKGLLSKQSPGNHNSLTTKQRAKVIRDLKKSPRDFGYPISSWSPPTLAMYLQKKFQLTMSMEWCRTFLINHLKNDSTSEPLNHLSLKKAKKEFKNVIKDLSNSGSDVWIFGQFYVGYRPIEKVLIRNRGKRAIVLCAEKYNGLGTICHLVNPSRDKEEEWEDLLNATLKKAKTQKLNFYLPKSQYTKFVVSRFRNTSKRDLSIDFLPHGLSHFDTVQDVKNEVLYELKKSQGIQKHANAIIKKYNKEVLTQAELEKLKEILEKLSAK
ncbi:helix-turn-helix domain-containing protein [Paenibacillus sp. ALE2]